VRVERSQTRKEGLSTTPAANITRSVGGEMRKRKRKETRMKTKMAMTKKEMTMTMMKARTVVVSGRR
jgi:hypothetical protein